MDGDRTLILDTIDHNFVSRFFLTKLWLNAAGMFVVGVLLVATIHILTAIGFVVWDVVNFREPYLDPAWRCAPCGVPLDHRAIDFLKYQLGEWPVFLVFWVGLPLLVSFYPWSVRFSEVIYERLRSQRILKLSRTQILPMKADLRRLARGLGNRSAVLIVVVVECGLFVNGLISPWDEEPLWNRTPGIGRDIWLFYAVGVPGYILLVSIIADMAKRFFGTIRGLQYVFRDEQRLDLRPWHPDGAAGLGVVSNYAVTIGWLIAAIGLILLLFSYISATLRAAEGAEIWEVIKAGSGI